MEIFPVTKCVLYTYKMRTCGGPREDLTIGYMVRDMANVHAQDELLLQGEVCDRFMFGKHLSTIGAVPCYVV